MGVCYLVVFVEMVECDVLCWLVVFEYMVFVELDVVLVMLDM